MIGFIRCSSGGGAAAGELCDPFDAEPCQSQLACYFAIVEGETNPRLTCAPIGNLDARAVCTLANQCKAGLACAGGRCRAFCRATKINDCPEEEECRGDFVLANSQTTGVRHCLPRRDACVPFVDAQCPGTLGCYFETTPDQADPTFICDEPGAKEEGSECEFANECLPGLNCTPAEHCRTLCRTNVDPSDCPTAQICADEFANADGTSSGASFCIPGRLGCSPFAAERGCPSGQFCVVGRLPNQNQSQLLCLETGAGSSGSECTRAGDCSDGLVCTPTRVCRDLCQSDGSGCPAGQDCASAFENMIDGESADFCAQGCSPFGPEACIGAEACLFVEDASRSIKDFLCIPPGAGALGASCTFHADCEKGLACDAGNCRTMCRTDAMPSDCPNGQDCTGNALEDDDGTPENIAACR